MFHQREKKSLCSVNLIAFGALELFVMFDDGTLLINFVVCCMAGKKFLTE